VTDAYDVFTSTESKNEIQTTQSGLITSPLYRSSHSLFRAAPAVPYRIPCDEEK